MNNEGISMKQWQAFLDKQGAVRDSQGTVMRFDTPSLSHRLQLCACDHWRVLGLRGEDAEEFLQGQLTADVRDVTAGFSRLAMHLSLKGRGLVSMRLLPAVDGFDILVPASMTEVLPALLKKYLMFSSSQLTVDDTRVLLALIGDQAAESLARAGLPVPHAADAVTSCGAMTLINAGAGQRYLVLLPAADACVLWETLIADCDPGGASQALHAEIAAGEGHVLPGAEDLFLPQALNYDLLQGVSFNKGCYTGQEVVARMHFRGEVKQRLRRVGWPGTRVLPPGTVLRDAAGKHQGEVVVSVSSEENTNALVVARSGYEDDLFVDTVPLQVYRLPLPYEDASDTCD